VDLLSVISVCERGNELCLKESKNCFAVLQVPIFFKMDPAQCGGMTSQMCCRDP